MAVLTLGPNPWEVEAEGYMVKRQTKTALPSATRNVWFPEPKPWVVTVKGDSLGQRQPAPLSSTELLAHGSHLLITENDKVT